MDRITNLDSEFQSSCSITNEESLTDEEIVPAVKEAKNDEATGDNDVVAAEFLEVGPPELLT